MKTKFIQSASSSVSLPLPWKCPSELALLCLPCVSVVSTLTYVNWVLYAWWIKKSTWEGAGCTGSQHTDSWRSLGSESSWHWPSCQEERHRDGLDSTSWLWWIGFQLWALSPPSRAQPGQPNPRLSPQRTVKEHAQLTTRWGPSMEDKSLGCWGFFCGSALEPVLLASKLLGFLRKLHWSQALESSCTFLPC